MKIIIVVVVVCLVNFVKSSQIIRRGKFTFGAGCSLKRLPEIQKFLKDDILLYYPLLGPGGTRSAPELLLYGEEEEPIYRIPVHLLSRDEIVNVLNELGFYRKASIQDPEPEGYNDGWLPRGERSVEAIVESVLSMCRRQVDNFVPCGGRR